MTCSLLSTTPLEKLKIIIGIKKMSISGKDDEGYQWSGC